MTQAIDLEREFKIVESQVWENYRSINDIQRRVNCMSDNNREITELKEEVKELTRIYEIMREQLQEVNPYLTKKEQIVLNNIKLGIQKKAIAKQLNIDNSAVSYYVRKLKKKNLI